MGDLAAPGWGPDDVRLGLRWVYVSWALVVVFGGPAIFTGASTARNWPSLLLVAGFTAASGRLVRVAPSRVRGPVWALFGLAASAPVVSVAVMVWVGRGRTGIDVAVHPLAFAELGAFALAASGWFAGEGFGRASELWRRVAGAVLGGHVVYGLHLATVLSDGPDAVVWCLSAVIVVIVLVAVAWAMSAAEATRQGLVRASWLHQRTPAVPS